MPTLRDCALAELALRNGALTTEVLQTVLARQTASERQNIPCPLASILVERKILPASVVKALSQELLTFAMRCKPCGKLTRLTLLDRSGNLDCAHCHRSFTGTHERYSATDFHKCSRGDTVAAIVAEELAATSLIKKHRLKELGGLGPCGSLYLAEETSRRLVAIKVFDRAISADKEGLARWTEYMKAAQDLSSATTPRPVRLFSEDGVVYAVRPHVGDARSQLAHWLTSSPTTAHDASSIREHLVAILRSLDEFHRARIAHGNLKPTNVILASPGATLLDPGLHFLLSGLSAQERYLRRRDSMRYLAPECLQDAEPDAAADLFAVGRMLEDLLRPGTPTTPAADSVEREQLSRLAGILTAPAPGDRLGSATAVLAWLEDPPAARAPSALPCKATRLRATLGALRNRLPEVAGLAALLSLATLVSWRAFTSVQGPIAFAADTARSEAALERNIRRDLEAMERWSRAEARTEAELDRQWRPVFNLVAQTPFKTLAAQARERAIRSLAENHSTVSPD